VAGVVAAGDDPIAEVLLLGDLADEDVVLVVAGDGHDEMRALDARPLEHPQLGAVAVLHGMLELLLDAQVGGAVGLDERDLLPVADQLAREVQPDLAAADDDDVHQDAAISAMASWNIAMPSFTAQIVCRPCSAY